MTPRKFSHQGGVAVVTALLLTTLAITIVASLFWQQQVQIRSIENQRLQLQKQWILRGALDWASLILRADAANSGPDHLGEPWAVPLAETRLDQYVENGRSDADASDATISGNIIDAQSRFNLRNLSSPSDYSQVDPSELETFRNLLAELKVNPGLADAAAKAITDAAPKTNSGAPQTGAPPSSKRILNIEYLDDLLAVPGFTPEILDKLRDFVVVLPSRTPVNLNTASVQVLAAKFAGLDTLRMANPPVAIQLSKSDAAVLVAARDHAYLLHPTDIWNRLQRPGGTEIDPFRTGLDVKTDYFLVNGKVRLNRASLDMQALILRRNQATKLVWIREN